MPQYPYTIDNGHHERITFLGRDTVNGIERLELENYVMPGGGPPMHVHFQQEESLTVISGKMTIQEIGKNAKVLTIGQGATFKSGVVHRFWNGGPEPLICKGHVYPPLNFEKFITAVFESTAASHNARPATFDMAYLLNRYGKEFGMGEIPQPVLKIVFPMVLFFGRLGGKHRKFEILK